VRDLAVYWADVDSIKRDNSGWVRIADGINTETVLVRCWGATAAGPSPVLGLDLPASPRAENSAVDRATLSLGTFDSEFAECRLTV